MSKIKTSTCLGLFRNYFKKKKKHFLIFSLFFLTLCTLCAIGSAVDCKCGLWPLLASPPPNQAAASTSLHQLHLFYQNYLGLRKCQRHKSRFGLWSPQAKRLTASSSATHQPLVAILSVPSSGQSFFFWPKSYFGNWLPH